MTSDLSSENRGKAESPTQELKPSLLVATGGQAGAYADSSLLPLPQHQPMSASDSGCLTRVS